MNIRRILAVYVSLTVLVPVVLTNRNPILMKLYFRSLAKLCGWAQCQGLCQHRDEILSPTEYYNRRCSANRYNEVVNDAEICPGALCISNSELSVNDRRNCRPNFETQTACYNLYRNETTGKVQTRICWDQSPYCSDLVNFCKSQRAPECTSYSSVTTLPPTSKATSGRLTTKVYTTENTTVTKYTEARSTSEYHNTVTAKPSKSGAFAAGAISGICAAVIPMIIALVVIMCLRRRKRNQFQVSDASKRKDSMELGGGPVYASIAPDLPIRQENMARGDISSSARSLHVSAPRANLLGNLQRNKSLPALAYEVNSVPMETNDVLRTVSMANRLSGLSESPSSPRSPLAPNNLDDLQQRSVKESETSEGRKGRSPVPSWTSEQSIKANRRDPSKHITAQNGSTGLTNRLYDEAILPGPPSKYAESENGSCHNADLTDLDKPKQTAYTSLQVDPSITENDKGMSEGIAEYTGLELDTPLNKSTVVPYAVLCSREDIGDNSLESNKYASLEPIPQQGTNNTKVTKGQHQYTEYVEDEDNDDTGSNEYMGIPEKTTSQQGTAYMGLQSNGLNATNEYMGIGDGIAGSKAGHEPNTVQVGNGAYAELSLLDRGNDPKSAYMDLHSPATQSTGEKNASEASIGSNIGLDQACLKSKSPGTKKEKQDDKGKSKFWKSKSTFHRRDRSNDGLAADKQKQAKPKKSFLFRRKKDKLELSKKETLKSDMCLDFNLGSPSPTYSNPAPHYFTLDVDSAKSHSRGIEPGSNIFDSIPEYQEDEDYDAETADEPFRPRSQSQPAKRNNSTVQCEVYETITDDWFTSREPSGNK